MKKGDKLGSFVNHSKLKKKTFMKKAFRILKYAKPYWKVCISLFFVSIILSLLGLVSPYLVKILIDDILLGKRFDYLLYLMLVYIGMFFFNTFVGLFFSYKSTQLGENIVLRVKTELFQHLENLDLGFFYTRKVGDILYRLDEDVYSIDSFIGLVIDDFLMNVLTAIFILGICLTLNWKVTLASLTFFPFYLLAQKYFSKIIKKKRKVLIKKTSNIWSFLQEKLSTITAIKVYVLENTILSKYFKKNRELIRLNLNMDLVENYSSSVIGFITFTPMIIILWYGSYNVMTGVLSIGSLMALYTYIGKLFGPISSLGSLNITLQSIMVSVDRVFEFLDKKPKIKELANAIPVKKFKGEIEFKNVNFSYDQKEPVFIGLNLKINPTEVVGLVGPSGSGKTTIANLICRFYDPDQGVVTLDGIDLKRYRIKPLRNAIGIVSQETTLFNATIMDNIKIGNLKATDAEVIEAAKLANVHEFIIKLPKKYKTMVGERGVNLSGGQKQRISIARAILKNPQIVILDEATSFLDAESEQFIQESMEYVTKGKTTVIIAHRLTTIKNVDKIVVLKDYKVAEVGSFEELMNKRGEFFKLYNSQFRGSQSFNVMLKKELQNSVKYKTPICMGIISIENFKRLFAADKKDQEIRLLDAVYNVIQANLDKGQFMSTMPNMKNIFLVVMPRSDPVQAKAYLEKIMNSVGEKINAPLEFKVQIASDPQSIAKFAQG